MKLFKTDKLTIAIIIVVILGMLAFFWGSQFYYPKNYLPASGTTQAGSWSNRGEKNYYVNFTTQDGQTVTYLYQTFNPVKPATLQLYYNSQNPQQVRVKPSMFQVIAELLIIFLLVPYAILVMSSQFKQNGFKGLVSKPKGNKQKQG